MKSTNQIAGLRANRETATAIRRVELLDGPMRAVEDALHGRPCLMVVSENVERLHRCAHAWLVSAPPARRYAPVVIADSEAEKSLESVEQIIRAASSVNLPRDGVILGVGGGVLLDIVGLAASLYRRGVSHFKVGTTLVAQVDAAIGLKCGANVGSEKNLAGAFHPAETVFVDGAFLRTIDVRQVRCGIAEMAKLAIARDRDFFSELDMNAQVLLDPRERDSAISRSLIDRAICGMVDELNANPYEHELKRPMDFGHTVSAAFEVATDYNLAHGEAVALDIAYFSTVSHLLGVLELSELRSIVNLLNKTGLDVWHPVLDQDDLILRGMASSTAHRGQKLNLPLPSEIGKTFFVEDRADIPDEVLCEAASLLRKLAASGTATAA